MTVIQGDDDSSIILSKEQVESFLQDGYIVVRDLFDEIELQQVVSEGTGMADTRPGTFFSIITRGTMYCNDAFRSMALHSKMPQVAAELMQLDPNKQNIRVLRDVFLVKDVAQNETCGWHVDDQGFWPESYLSTAAEDSGKDQYGINAWIALDDMPKAYKGSMAVVPGSHKASWRWEAYEAIGQDRTKAGTTTKDDFVTLMRRSTQLGTCKGVEHNRQDLLKIMEDSCEVFDLKRGDVIFATRLLFHRTVEVTPEGKEYFAKRNQMSLMRYSVRYVPGTAILPAGFSTEWSLVDNPANGARTLDEVASDPTNECWYPQVWPTVNEGSGEKTVRIDESKIAKIKEKEKELFAEIKTLIEGMNA